MIIFLAHSRVWRSYNPQNLRAISVWRAGDENYSPISLRSFCFLTAERFCKKLNMIFRTSRFSSFLSISDGLLELAYLALSSTWSESISNTMFLSTWRWISKNGLVFSIATFVWSFLSIRRKMSKRWWLQLRWDDDWQLVHERFSK